MWPYLEIQSLKLQLVKVGCGPAGEGNGNPLQYSCLENPMDRGAWQAVVHRVTENWARLKRLSMHVLLLELDGPQSNNPVWLVYLEKGKCGQTCTWAEHHGKIKAEIGVMLLQAKGHQKLGSTWPEARREALNSFSLGVLRKSQTCQYFHLELLAFRTEAINSYCLSCLAYVICYGIFSKLIQLCSQG